MAQILSQEEYDRIMSGWITDGNRYVVIESTSLSVFSETHGVKRPILSKSNYNNGFYYRIGDKFANIPQITPKELITGALHYTRENNGAIPPNVYIDKIVDTYEKKLFYHARIEPNDINFFVIKANQHLKTDVEAYYHTYYKGFKKPGNPDFINILKNQPTIYPDELLSQASQELKTILNANLPKIKEKIACDVLTIVLAPRAKAIQDDWYQQLRKSVTEWCFEHKNEGFEDGCNYIIRHTNTPTTHLGEEGDIYPGMIKETCYISPEIEGKDILFMDDIYTFGVNIDEDSLQAIINNNPKTLTFYSVAKTLKKEE